MRDGGRYEGLQGTLLGTRSYREHRVVPRMESSLSEMQRGEMDP